MNTGVPLRKPQYIQNQDRLDTAIQSTIRVFVEAGVSHDGPLQAVEGVVGYSLLYNRDLSCILEDIETPPTPAHANLYGRMVVLLADELFTKIPDILGKDFRGALKAWEVPTEHRDRMADCQRRFRSLRMADAAWCEEIRNNAIAHRDAGFGRQWRLIGQFDVNRANGLAGKLLEWTNELYGVMVGILAHRANVVAARRTA